MVRLAAKVKGKTKSTYMTAEKRVTAQNNIQKYSWAAEEARSYIEKAEQCVDELDYLYSMITSQGLPRNKMVGAKNDPDSAVCRYCGASFLGGMTAWKMDPYNEPWKIQCPECDRKFPSNDFESLYKLGLNAYGEYDRELALSENQKLIDSGFFAGQSEARQKYGYMANDLYPELYDGSDLPEDCKVNFAASDDGTELDMMCWGADDGFGYDPGRTYYSATGSKICVERHTYIAYFVHRGLWNLSGENSQIVRNAIMNSAYAYFYTGDIRYGKVAAVLLDRVADFYKEMDVYPYKGFTWNYHGGSGKGKIIGEIHDAELATNLATAYDMVFDIYEDQSVLDYIGTKAETIKMRYAKETASQIRTNIEDNFLREALSSLEDGSIHGNFGMAQKTCATAAVVLDTEPDTTYWLDWLYRAEWTTSSSTFITGGSVNQYFIDKIDHVLFGKLNEPTFFKLNALVFETIYTDIRNPCTRFCILF